MVGYCHLSGDRILEGDPEIARAGFDTLLNPGGCTLWFIEFAVVDAVAWTGWMSEQGEVSKGQTLKRKWIAGQNLELIPSKKRKKTICHYPSCA